MISHVTPAHTSTSRYACIDTIASYYVTPAHTSTWVGILAISYIHIASYYVTPSAHKHMSRYACNIIIHTYNYVTPSTHKHTQAHTSTHMSRLYAYNIHIHIASYYVPDSILYWECCHQESMWLFLKHQYHTQAPEMKPHSSMSQWNHRSLWC